MEMINGEYDALRTQAELSMRDKCKIGVRSAITSDDPGDFSYVYGSEIDCGLTPVTKGEEQDGSQATVTDAIIRLPWGTSINVDDRIQITEQADVTISSDNIYAVIGAPYQALANVRANLKRLTGTSVL